jgi:hypothetical protein
MSAIATLGDLAHLHLLLNHAPTVGATIAVGLLVLAFIRKSDDLATVALELSFGVALITLPVFFTGLAAQAALAGAEGVSVGAITSHEDAALFSFVMMCITGAVSWVAIWQRRRSSRPTRAMVVTVFVLSCLTLSAMARTALLGGAIRHPEISSAGGAVEAGGGWLTTKAVAGFVTQHEWVWPTSEALHFLGMSLMFGTLLIVSLRLMGGMRSMSFAAAHRLLPFGVLGFAINVVTGMLFFISAPEQYVDNVSFHWKVVLLELMGACFLVLTVYDRLWTLPAGGVPPRMARVLAVLTLVAAVGVMYFGRMLPFIGDAF